jgi:mono/diheme cytochrome c family protein
LNDQEWNSMKSILTTEFLLLAVCPSSAQKMSYGQAEFLDSCAMCHGSDGRGDGDLAPELKTKPADLTVLARDNGGEFPSWRVSAVIDGRYIIPAHGGRDMPIWGSLFLESDAEEYNPEDAAAVTQERIRQITEYIATLQR